MTVVLLLITYIFKSKVLLYYLGVDSLSHLYSSMSYSNRPITTVHCHVGIIGVGFGILYEHLCGNHGKPSLLESVCLKLLSRKFRKTYTMHTFSQKVILFLLSYPHKFPAEDRTS